MPMNIPKLKTLVTAHLEQDKLPLKFLKKRTKEQKASIIAELLVTQAAQSSEDLMAILTFLKHRFHHYKAQPQGQSQAPIIERIQLLKSALKDAKSTWWEAFQPQVSQVVIDQTFIPLRFNPSSAYPIIDNPARFLKAVDKAGQYYALQGSTFCTNHDTVIERNKTPDGAFQSHVLDAVYTIQLQTKDGLPNGYCVALSDGCGGHFGEAAQDKAIATTARKAAKYAAQVMAACKDADGLYQAMPQIITQVDGFIRLMQTTSQYKEGSTLVCYRAFMQPHGIRLVGFNIGDSMLVSYGTSVNQFNTLSPARTFVSQINGTEATAIFPISYKPEDIAFFDVKSAEDMMVFALSDGVYEGLPCTENVTGNLKHITLDAQRLLAGLPEVPAESRTVASISQALVAYALQHQEQMRAREMADIDDNRVPLLDTKGAAIQTKLTTLRQYQGDMEKAKPLASDTDAFQQWLKQKKALQTNIKKKQDKYDTLRAACYVQQGDDFSLIGVGLFKAPGQKRLTAVSLTPASLLSNPNTTTFNP